MKTISQRWIIFVILLMCSLGARPVSAQLECDTWRLVNPLPTNHDLHDVAYSNGYYSAVGDDGTFLISDNEVNWQEIQSLTTVDLNAVVGHNDGFWAVGDAGIFITGRIGAECTSVTTSTSKSLSDLASHDLTTIVAVGDDGTIVVSLDRGNTWTLQNSGSDKDLNAVVWTGNDYIAVGEEGVVLASTDGLLWTEIDLDSDDSLKAVASNGAVTVIVSNQSRSFVSSGDGTWTTINIANGVTDVAWIGDRFVTAGTLLSSADAVVWHGTRLTSPGLELNAVGPPGGESPMTIAVGRGGMIVFSNDKGEHWKPANTLTGLTLYGMASNDSVAVAAAGNFFQTEGALLVSDDLTNWEVVYERNLETFYDVAANSDTFMAVGVINELWGGGALILSSIDGRNWNNAVDSTTGRAWPWAFHSIVWDGWRWIASGGATLAVSVDGSNWELVTAETGGNFLGVACNSEVAVAVGERGQITIMDLSNTLTNVHVACDEILRDVAWGNQTFVAVGDAGSIMTSGDGSTWVKRESGILGTPGNPGDLNSVRWTGQAFVAVGPKGLALHSTDGATWQPINIDTDTDLWDLMITNTGAVACGEDGLLMRNLCTEPGQEPAALFTWRPNQPEEGSRVQFIDLSTGNPSSWTWDFADGATANTRAATHSFSEHGSWPVSLNVGNSYGDDQYFADVKVRRYCGAPPTAILQAPDAVASTQPYTVSWESVLQDWESGEYLVHESRDPSFTDTSTVVSGESSTSASFSHPWTDGGVFFYRLYARNYCQDSTYTSSFSAITQVNIEPDINDLGENIWVIPAAATGEGLNGTLWKSDIVIHNPHPYGAPVYVVYLPRAGEGEAIAGPRLNILAHTSLHLHDALSPFAQVMSGALLVISDRTLQVVSRTFNDQPNGSYGQFIAGVPVSGAVKAGDETRLIQLTENQAYRTNLALANPRPQNVEANVQFFRADGTFLGESKYAVPPLGSVFDTQVLRRHTPEVVNDAFAVVSSVDANSQLIAMASVVDNHTGDPVTHVAHDNHVRRRVVMIEPPLIRTAYDQPTQLIFAHGVWVGAGLDGIAISENGVDWEIVVDLSHPPYGSLSGLSFNGSQIVAVGYHTAFVSIDAKNWAQIEYEEGRLESVTWDTNKWFAVGPTESSTLDETAISTSSDGLNWHTEILEGLRVRSVIWAGDRYVGATNSGIAYSRDGLSWHAIDFGLWIQKVAWNGSQFIALSDNNLATSIDGESWVVQPIEAGFDSVIWAHDRWVLGARIMRQGNWESTYLVSADGEAWESFPRSGASGPVSAIGSDGANVLAIDYFGSLSFLVSDTAIVTVPAVAHIGGYGHSSWRSDLELHNPHGNSVRCAVELLRRDARNLETNPHEITVAPSSSVRMRDVVADFLGAEGAGALRITPTGGAIMVSSRTYDDSSDGTFGQFVPGLRDSDAVWHFEAGILLGLAHSEDMNSGFRSNIGLVSACPDPMEVKIDLHRGAGDAIGSVMVDLPPFAVHQLNNIFAEFTRQPISDAFALLTTSTAGCSFFAYASVIDNRTNDPILIPAMHGK